MGNIAKGFRDQQLSTTPRARSRLYNAQAAMLEQQMQPQTPSIIGGQFIGTGNDDAINAAQAGLRDRKATADAQRLMRQQMGSTTVTRGKPGGLGDAQQLGAGQIPATSAVNPSQPAMNGDAVYPGGPSFSSLMQPPGPDTTTGAPNNTFVSQQGDTTLRQVGSFFNQENPSPLRRNVRSNAGDSSQPTTLDSELDTGMRNGGMVNKQRMVKQPGYKGGGKVKMPGQPCGMRGYATGGQIGDEMQDDGRDTVDVRVREGEYMLNPETVAAFGAGDYEAGASVLDGIVTATTGEQPGPTPVNEAGEEVQQGMRNGGGVKMGYAAGGQFDMFGNATSDAGIRARARATADAAAERARMAQVAAQEKAWVQPRAATEIPAGAREAASAQNAKFNANANMKPAPAGARDAAARANKFYNVGKGAGNVANTLRPAVNAVKNVGNFAASTVGRFPLIDTMVGMAADEGTYYDLDPEQGNFDLRDWNGGEGANRAWNAFAEDSANRLMTAGGGLAGTIDDVSRLAPGPGIAGAQDAYEAFLASQFGDQVLPQNRGKAPYRTGISEMVDYFSGGDDSQQGAAGEPTPAPDPYGRAFGAGNVDLNNAGLRNARAEVAPGGMNVVQNTGGPDGEVIVREDINGVPTFTNLRRGGFDGSPRNLQAEADARAAQDVGIRAMQEQTVQQMRDNAPIYDQAGVDQRRSENLAMQQTAMEASGRRGTVKAADIAKEKNARFARPVLDEDGQPTGKTATDPADVNLFDDTMSKLAPAIIEKFGAPFDQLDQATRNQVYDFFEEVKNDTIAGNRAGQQIGVPTSEVPRTGANSLRAIPGDISLGDVWGPNFTIPDYTAGMFDGKSLDDVKVQDPVTGGQMSLRRLLQQNPGAGQEAIQRYGIDPAVYAKK